MTASDYLKKPYARRLVPDENGGYVATIQEFPGLIADGETADEAISNLESAAEAWIEAAVATGERIPEPVSLHGYSGRIALRMPRGLHKQVAEMASLEGTSVNQWLVYAISSHLGRCQHSQQVSISTEPYSRIYGNMVMMIGAGATITRSNPTEISKVATITHISGTQLAGRNYAALSLRPPRGTPHG